MSKALNLLAISSGVGSALFLVCASGATAGVIEHGWGGIRLNHAERRVRTRQVVVVPQSTVVESGPQVVVECSGSEAPTTLTGDSPEPQPGFAGSDRTYSRNRHLRLSHITRLRSQSAPQVTPTVAVTVKPECDLSADGNPHHSASEDNGPDGPLDDFDLGLLGNPPDDSNDPPVELFSTSPGQSDFEELRFTGQFLETYPLVSPEQSENVPIPGTLVLIGIGLAGLGVARRRKAH